MIRSLGSGGESNVFLVQHIPTEQLRAAKVLKSDRTGDRMHELRMIRRLRHRALPQMIDVLEEDGEIWLIMEYIVGRSLTEACADGMDGEEFFRIARELLDVLMYLHALDRPLLHLDIKPSNVMLKRDGHLVLIDFGAAAFLQRDGTCQAACGTPGFAAPEQFVYGKKLDVRADQYGYGATLQYCLKRGMRTAVKWRKQQESDSHTAAAWKYLAPLRAPGWERRTEQILERCQCADPADRYPEEKQLALELTRAQSRYRFGRWMRGAAGALLLLFLVLCFAVHTWQPFSATTEPDRFSDIQEKTPETEALQEAEKTKEAEQILLERASQSGFSTAVEYYSQAARLRPDGDWALHFLDRTELDGEFTREEETALQQILYQTVSASEQTGTASDRSSEDLTDLSSDSAADDSEHTRTVQEWMQQKPEQFGEFAYRMGVEYWYYYQESGGKSAAARWFQLALATDGAQQADWYASASIHADIGSYYEKLGQIEDEDRRRDALCTYWDDLRQLWQMAESETMQVQVRMQIGTEMCSCLLMGAAEIAGSGESQDTLLQILDEVETWADMLQTEQETQQETDLLEEGIQEQNLQKQKDEMNDVCFAARMAVERVFADERGMAFETETAAE